jgi:hypothetical protein
LKRRIVVNSNRLYPCYPRLRVLLLALALLLAPLLGLVSTTPARAQARPSGNILGWGWNHVGQLDIPAGLTDVVAVSASQITSLALKSDGTVVAWGFDVNGAVTVPAGLSNVVAISAGSSHSLALKDNGTVVAWGCGGGYDYDQCTIPAAATGVTAIAAGAVHSVALRSNGSVIAWGASYAGQRSVPNAALSGVIAIAAGGSSDHTLALKNNGTVVAWGDNQWGQTDVPAGLNNVVAIATGYGHSVAVKTDGTVVAWSDNYEGRTDVPAGLTGVIAIAASWHNLVIVPASSDPPTITPNVVGTLGSNVWYTSDVGVAWTVTPNGAGVSSQTGCTTQNVTSDTSGITFTCTATSVNGGSSSQSVTIKRDATRPTISAAATSSANSAGWYNSDVTVRFTCSDALAGVVSCPTDQVLSTEGAAVSSTAQTVTDQAGNISQPSNVVTVAIDRTPPTVSAAATTSPNTAGWYNAPVTVAYSCADALSGIPQGACPSSQTLNGEGAAVNSAAPRVQDVAGNTSAPSNVVTVAIDRRAPSITAAATTNPNSANWYNAPVTVAFSCTDTLSGIPQGACPSSQTLSAEGAAVNSTAQTVSDAAGNASIPSNIVTVAIDRTAPVVSVSGVTNGASYPLGSVPAATCSSSDALSGVATEATLSISGGNADGAGSFTASCAGASDKAGNSGSASVSYQVVYRWSGFFQPIDNLPTVNSVKAGQAIPVKFSLGGDYGLNIFAQGYPKSQQVACDSGAPIDDIEQTVTAGSSSLSYDPTTGQYNYTWKTDKSWAGSCRLLVVRLSDGTEHTASFTFK